MSVPPLFHTVGCLSFPNMAASRAFLAYSHADNQHDDEFITQLRKKVLGELRSLTAKDDFEIYSDTSDLQWGQNWRAELKSGLRDSTFLIPIVTPQFLKSKECRAEVLRFHELETARGRNDLILPIYYISSAAIGDDVPAGYSDEEVQVAKIINDRQYVDWRELRHEAFTDARVKKKVTELVKKLQAAFERVTSAPKTPMPSPAPLVGSLDPAVNARQEVLPPKPKDTFQQILDGWSVAQREFMEARAEAAALKAIAERDKKQIADLLSQQQASAKETARLRAELEAQRAATRPGRVQHAAEALMPILAEVSTNPAAMQARTKFLSKGDLKPILQFVKRLREKVNPETRQGQEEFRALTRHLATLDFLMGAFTEIGHDHYAHSDYDEAAEAYGAVLDLAEDDDLARAGALVGLGNIDSSRGELAAAEAKHSAALALVQARGHR